MSKRRVALTTTDNEWNPFTQFKEWLTYDMQQGHGCCDLIGRLATTSSQFTDEENWRETERAIDEIIERDPTGLYIKVYE